VVGVDGMLPEFEFLSNEVERAEALGRDAKAV
jgi:hypothetical protein